MSTRIDEQQLAPDRDAPSLPQVPGNVKVVVVRRRQRSVCTCGWRGRRRVLRSLSVLDALDHAARGGCHPAVPLVRHDPDGTFADVDIGPRP
ncbi:MAG: hypothetical protein QOE30_1250 [Mycobacterium sp.]|jgi:hypothetical protein|uniref:hypothetical protein n=1 Tax=Mycobacterium sp. TaxID=1785 RepID=UPI0028B6E5E7|nr:hypothetical protein [Mycobacterium sp.]MDT5115511.1 hypothetical protein [Mycobacterium sp.]